MSFFFFFFFFFNDTATTEIYTLSLHDALPISLLDRKIRRVAAVTKGDQVGGVMVDGVEECFHGHALPHRVELRPLRDAMDVVGDALARQRAELVPSPDHRLTAAANRERPLFERRARCRPRRQDREVIHQVLARWDAATLDFGIAPPALEAARDKGHAA